MKSIQRIAAAVAVLMMVIAAQHVHAQVAGGWSNVSTSDAGVVAAARFAVEEEGRRGPITLKKIIHARQQVVAGMNYEITLLIKHGRGSSRVVAVVWHKTDGSYALTSWTAWKGKKK
jgi:hypothetical protein